jgi:hypothetical protein
VVLTLLALLAVKLAPLLLEPNRYTDIVSIEKGASFRDAALMKQAWRMPVAARYARQPYEFQHNQSFCGPTAAADVLHSLGDARSQIEVIAAAPYRTIFGYLPGGLTLDEEADLLRRASGRPVMVRRGLTLDQFRGEMHAVNDPGRRYIVNFHRGPLFGRGHGHFSPLLAYLPERDLVLVGDVNANYRPFLVTTARLWAAVDTVDDATGKKRGLAVMITPGQHKAAASEDGARPFRNAIGYSL